MRVRIGFLVLLILIVANTGEPLGKTARVEMARQTIYHDREHPSYIVLPIVPRRPNT